jgi:hypothetical protein
MVSTERRGEYRGGHLTAVDALLSAAHDSGGWGEKWGKPYPAISRLPANAGADQYQHTNRHVRSYIDGRGLERLANEGSTGAFSLRRSRWGPARQSVRRCSLRWCGERQPYG